MKAKEIEKNKQIALTKLSEFRFGDSDKLPSDVLTALAFCKIYHESEYDKFVNKCKAFNLYTQIVRQEIESYVRKLKHLIKQEHNLQKVKDKQTKKKEFEESRNNNIIELQKLQNKPPSDERDAEMIALINQSLELNGAGMPIANVKNYELIFKYDPNISDCIGYDAFAYKLVPLRNDLSWKHKSLVKLNEWNDLDDSALQNYINRTYGNLNSEKIFRNVLTELANKNSFHPVREYFENLPTWDGKARARTLFIDSLGVENSEYSREITFYWLKSAVARIYYPGCKADHCLVLKGKQGKGKSTMLAKLGGIWFNDSIFDISGKEALENLQGNWIIELGEMQAARRADNEAIKAFLSRQVDKFRLPYGRRTSEFPRQCVFAATTNLPEFLKDRSGGRRFWILICDDEYDSFKFINQIDQDYIDQVWAEVWCQFSVEEPFDAKNLLPPEEILQQARELQENYTEGGSLDGMITAFLEMLIPENEIWDNMSKLERRKYAETDGRGFSIPTTATDEYGVVRQTTKDVPAGTRRRDTVCPAEIAYECFKIENPNRDRTTLKEITEVLDQLPNWILKGRMHYGVYGDQKKIYKRKVR